jgi:hypothetical protein
MSFLKRLFGGGDDSAPRVSNKASETWSWTLRSAYIPVPAAFAEGFPTEKAARQAAEEEVQSRGGANWKRDHPHLSVTISGPNNQFYKL